MRTWLRRPALAPAATLLLACAAAGGADLDGAIQPSGTQAGVGARFGARDPRTCPSRKMPTRGAPSAAQAAQYFVCHQEEVKNDYLYLAEEVRVEVGRGRAYQVATDAWDDIDPAQPVYPIRGGYTGYQCVPLRTARELASGFADNRGTNCTRSPNGRATGACFKSTFGDWTCVMVDRSVGVESYVRGVAPPK